MWVKWGLLLGLAGRAAAVFRDDAGYIDGKDVFLGRPLAVSEHDSRLAVSSEAGVLAVLTVKGTFGWRQILADHQLESGIGFDGEQVVVGGKHLTAYNATNGAVLWTSEYPTTDVTATNDGVILDGKLIANLTGALMPFDGVEAAHYTPIEGSTVALQNGTLSWDEFGVLTYTTKDGSLEYTRDDGLANIEQAVFLKVPTGEKVIVDYELFEKSLASENDFFSAVATISYRLRRHLGQLYGLVRYVISNGPAMVALPEPEKEAFGFEQVIVTRTAAGSVYGLNATQDLNVIWVYHDLDAAELKRTDDSSQVAVISSQGELFTLTYDGEFAESSSKTLKIPGEELRVDGNVISSPLGWSVRLPGSEIVGSAFKDPEDVTASIVVPVNPNGDVLYKYLNPYLAAFASYSAETKHLVVTVLDPITGRIIAQNAHADPIVVSSEWPFNMAFGEHWVVYTYLSIDGTQAPKISVLELYESGKPNERLTTSEVNVYDDTLVPHIKSRSWIVPSHNQPVYSIALSKSAFGANARDVLLALEHQIVALPKLLLSAVLPTDPNLKVPQSGHLSHVIGVSRAKQIVTSSTNLESTYFVAAVGGPDVFITRTYPAGEFDRLIKSFPKVKLVIFVGVLAFAVSTLSPLARLKKLKMQWR